MKKITSFEIKKYLKSISEYISDNGVKKNAYNACSITNTKKNSISWVSSNELKTKTSCAYL